MKTKGITPEELIETIKGTKVRITPIIQMTTPDGEEKRVVCDCSGCSNPSVVIDVFSPEDLELEKSRYESGNVAGYMILKD